MTQKTPDPAVEELPAVGVVGVALPPPSFSDLRPTDSRLGTRRSCAPAAPNTRTTFFGSAGGRCEVFLKTMVPVIVPVYAAVLVFIYIVLSARVIQARWSAKVAIGTRGDIRLERKMRVHANFAEYVPFALLLATFIEMQGRPAWLVHLLCLALLAGRVVHAYGVSQERENIRLRIAGMATTFTVLAVMALSLLMRAIELGVTR